MEGKSLNSEIKSSSSSSTQLYCEFFWLVCCVLAFLTAGVWFLLIGVLDLDSVVSFFNWVLVPLSVGWFLIGVLDLDSLRPFSNWVLVALVVLFLGEELELIFGRYEDFLVVEEVILIEFEDLEGVGLSFWSCDLKLSFSDLVMVELGLELGLTSLVLFLVRESEKESFDFESFVWFLLEPKPETEVLICLV